MFKKCTAQIAGKGTATFDNMLFTSFETTKRYEEKVIKKGIIAQQGF